jgi:hypothetical protein
MAYLNTILSQLLVHVPRHDFQSLVSQHKADRYVKRFTTWNQLVTLLYAQAGDKKSLRDIQNGLSAHAPQLYHLGYTGPAAPFNPLRRQRYKGLACVPRALPSGIGPLSGTVA